MVKVNNIFAALMKINVKKVHHLTGHKSSLFAIGAYKNNYQFITGDGGGYAVLWNLKDTEKAEVMAKVDSNIFALQYLKSTNKLAIGTMSGNINFIDLREKKLTHQFNPACKAIFDFFLKNNLLYIATETGVLILYDIELKKVVNQVKISDKSLRSFSYNTINNKLAIGSSDHYIYIFDLATNEIIHQLSHHKNSVFSLKWLNENTIASGSRDAHLNIWKNNTLHKSLPAHYYTINCIAIAPNGKYFATAGKDKSIKIWDSETFDLIKVIDETKTEMHGNSVNKLLWTNYNDYLISVSDDRNIMVWQLNVDN